MTTTTKTGWVACDYTAGDRLEDVRHSDVCGTCEEAAAVAGYEGVRYVGSDGYLYVEAPE